jgi:RNA polymerase sigma-70 factor (ECF subfamily)
LNDRDELADLVAAVAERRDRSAFVRLFDHFAPRIKSYLMRLGSDAASAEEIAQDAMVTLWRKAELFDRSKSSVGTWLFRIARNRKIDLLRRDRTNALDAHDPMLLPAAAPDPDATTDAARLEGLVRRAFDALPADQRRLVDLAFFEGRSHSEIAAQTGIPLGTVKSRIRLAFSRLRRALEAEGVHADAI